jgi:urease accessory protein
MNVATARLLHLGSSALPVGGFAYSRGLETAVELGWVSDASSAARWIGGLLVDGAARLDAPVFVRLHRAFRAGDMATVTRWSTFLDAARETSELRQESRQMGAMMARLLLGLELATPAELRALPVHGHTALFALAAVRFEIAEPEAVEVFLWAWLEAQVLAAIKLVPLGQTDGQRILCDLAGRLSGLAHTATRLRDDEIGALTPGLAIASSRHETQHTRLFRS